jgi:Predicted periplasmic ligand-binding sensor domain
MRPAWLVLIWSLIATLIFWQLARNLEAANREKQLRAMSALVTDEIERRMIAYQQMLRAGAGVIVAKGEVNRADWREFVSVLGIPPGTLGLGYAIMVAPNELAQHEKKFRAVHGPDYHVRPPGQREIYSAIVFLEPENWRNQRAIGYDMLSEPRRRSAMEQAIAMGRVAVTGKVTLVQEVDTDVQAGVLMYFPVYNSPELGTALAERRRNLRGFVYTILRMGDFMTDVMESAFPSGPPLVHVELFDGQSVEPSALLFGTESMGNAANGATADRSAMVFLPGSQRQKLDHSHNADARF